MVNFRFQIVIIVGYDGRLFKADGTETEEANTVPDRVEITCLYVTM